MVTLRRSLLTLAIIAALAVPLAHGATFCVPPKPTPQGPPQDPKCPACDPKECDKCTKSPVLVGSGAYDRDDTDLSIRTPGLGIEVARHYESSRTVDGPFGIGWNGSITSRLHHAAYQLSQTTLEHRVYIVMPHGTLYEFSRTSSGVYLPPVGRRDSLVQNGDGTWTLALQDGGTVSRFNADGTIAWMKDEFGNAINYTYDANGRLQRVADGAGSGRFVDVTWNTSTGRIDSVTDSAGRTVRYTYNANGTLTSVADAVTPSGQQSIYYTYDTGRFAPVLTLVKDRWQRVISDIEWDEQWRVKSYTEGDYNDANPPASTGEKYTYEYHPEGSIGDPTPFTHKAHSLGGKSFRYHPATGVVMDDGVQYDSSGRATGYSDPVSGGDTEFVYDSQGRLSKEKIYDSQGQLQLTWTYTYDPAFPRKVLTKKSSLPAKWPGTRFEYFQAGSPAPGALKSVYQIRQDGTAEDLIRSFTYDSAGRLLTSETAGQPATGYTYNAAGDLTRVTVAGKFMAYEYDSLGRVTKETDRMGAATTYTYDAADRILTVTLPKPSAASSLDFTVTYDYDDYDAATGLVFTTITDPNGRSVKTGRDALERDVQTIDALGNIATFSYQYGLLRSITDANGNKTEYGYDSQRQLLSTTFPDGQVEQYVHASDGRLQSKTDRRGVKEVHQYDIYGRLKAVKYPDEPLWPGGLPKQLSYQYDGSMLRSVWDNLHAQTADYDFEYDTLFRVTKEGYTGGMQVSYEYRTTPGDQRKKYTVTPPSGSTDRTTSVHYTYDAWGRVKTLSFDGVNTEATINYNDRGQQTSVVFANGLTRNFTYDDQGRVLELSNEHPSVGVVAKYEYSYDFDWATNTYAMLGQQDKVIVTAAPGTSQVVGTTKYRYDANYHLIQVDEPGGKWDKWQYDAIGNRISWDDQGPSAPQTFEYYKYAGNTLNSSRLKVGSRSGTNLYDANGNRTNNATWDFRNQLVAYGSSSFEYDWMNRRTTSASTASVTRFTYVGQDLVRERDTTFNILNDYIFGPEIDQPLVRKDAGGAKTYFAVDALGSIVAGVTDTGAIVEGRAYTAWGDSPPPRPTFSYTGREPGPGGFLYYRARYYDPVEGRFLSEDPVPRPYGNPYQYANNQPLMLRDPLGLDPGGSLSSSCKACILECTKVYESEVAKCDKEKFINFLKCTKADIQCRVIVPIAFWGICNMKSITCFKNVKQIYKWCMQSVPEAMYTDCLYTKCKSCQCT